MLTVNDKIAVPKDEFVFSYARSSGPGGQNVNKLNTKVTMHWDVTSTSSLPEDVRERFCKKYRRRISKEGELVLYSQRFRDQARNVDDCLSKLREFILEVAEPPKPRKPTKPTRGSIRRRLDNKRKKGDKKQSRGQNWE